MPQADYIPINPTETDEGRLIQIAATSTPGTLIATATTATSLEWDAVYISICNNHTDDVLVTIEWGGTGSGDVAKIQLPAYSGFVPVIPMHRLRDTANIRIFASVTNVVNAYVDIDRIKDSES